MTAWPQVPDESPAIRPLDGTLPTPEERQLVDALQSLPPSLFRSRLRRAFELIASDDAGALARVDAMIATNDPERLEELAGRSWPEPEDRAAATLSELGGVEYVEDLIRPGRIVVVAAEEGTGKSYAVSGELAIRVAAGGGAFAGTWPILRRGPVLVLSEMHADDDYAREAAILDSLELTRASLAGRYYRLSLASAARDKPALQVAEWRDWIAVWLRQHAALLAVFDTATAAAQVDPWGGDIQAIYRGLRVMLEQSPELCVVLVVHLKKPQGRGGERRISDVIGEWGRWCDVLLLLERDGDTRVKLSSRKRVRHERRIVAVKRDGLLVDPQDLTDGSAPKVPQAEVVAAILAEPGISQKQLAARLGVTEPTARTYARTAEQAGLVRRESRSDGPGFALFAVATGDEGVKGGETRSLHPVPHPSKGAESQEGGEGVQQLYIAAPPLSFTPLDPADESEEELLAQLRLEDASS